MQPITCTPPKSKELLGRYINLEERELDLYVIFTFDGLRYFSQSGDEITKPDEWVYLEAGFEVY